MSDKAFTHTYHGNKLPRKGERCRILCRGGLNQNTLKVQFEDGATEIVRASDLKLSQSKRPALKKVAPADPEALDAARAFRLELVSGAISGEFRGFEAKHIDEAVLIGVELERRRQRERQRRDKV